MTDELPDVPSLRPIDPPPGGLARLRDAIADAGERRSARRRWIYAMAPVAVLLALVLWLRRDPEPIEAPPVAPVAMPDPAIAPTFYWVASTPGPSPSAPKRPVSYVEPADLPVPVLEVR